MVGGLFIDWFLLLLSLVWLFVIAVCWVWLLFNLVWICIWMGVVVLIR